MAKRYGSPAFPRGLVRNNTPQGRAVRRRFATIAAELGLTTPVLRYEGARVAMLWVGLDERTRELDVARHRRTKGKPTPEAIERLSRLHASAEDRWAQAMDRLRQLAAGNKPADLAQQFAQAHDATAYNGSASTAGLKTEGSR